MFHFEIIQWISGGKCLTKWSFSEHEDKDIWRTGNRTVAAPHLADLILRPRAGNLRMKRQKECEVKPPRLFSVLHSHWSRFNEARLSLV